MQPSRDPFGVLSQFTGFGYSEVVFLKCLHVIERRDPSNERNTRDDILMYERPAGTLREHWFPPGNHFPCSTISLFAKL